MSCNTILEALRELQDTFLESDTEEQKRLNKEFKKEVKKNVKLVPGATVHHLDTNLKGEEKLNATNAKNCVVINSNTKDSNLVHQLIHFCIRHNTNIENVLNEINKIDIIYKIDDDVGYIPISLDTAVRITK